MDNAKASSKAILGLIITLLGVYVAYYYITNLEKTSFLILLLSLVIISFGIFILVHVGKSGDTIFVDFEKTKNEEIKAVSTTGENFVDKNAKLSEDWAKTVEKKDKLKSLKIAAAAEEQANH
jgi:hypothetical protein